MAISVLLAAMLSLVMGCPGTGSRDQGRGKPAGSSAAKTTAGKAGERASSGASSGGTASLKGALLVPDKTYAVISGVLSWQDPALASFSPVQRKDQELYDHLLYRGVPKKHMRLLLDSDASRDNMLAATKQIAAAAPKGATLIFYYAGHGVKADDGKAYFACHDMRAKRSAETGFSLEALADTIAGSFRGERVLLMADCCYSGSLGAVAKRLSDKGISAVSLTSADESNVSTGNWTFSMSVLSCLKGDPLCDANGDGTIALSEMASEVRASMKHREGQLYGFSTHGVGGDVPVARAKSAKLKPARRREYVDARVDGRWVPARLRSSKRNQRKVRVFSYADHKDVAVSAGNTRKVAFKRYEPGSALKVFWGKKVWDAKVLRTDGDFHFITYPGWPSYWDEWVTSRRIAGADNAPDPPDDDAQPNRARFEVGAKVEVEWHGKWYPAQVLSRRGRRHHIHYDGYDDSWDEWVGPRRIRARAP